MDDAACGKRASMTLTNTGPGWTQLEVRERSGIQAKTSQRQPGWSARQRN